MNRTLLVMLLPLLLAFGLSTGCDKKKEAKPTTTAKADEAKKPDDKKAAEGDKKAAEGDKKAAEGDKKAAEGDKKAAEGDKKAAEGDKKAAEGDKKAGEGDKKAGEGDKKAAGGDTKRKLELYMQSHFDSIAGARNALVKGDLPEFKKQMGELADLKVPAGAPESWNPFIPKLAAAAKAGALVADLGAAAEAIGGVATACAKCHTATADTLRVLATGQPPVVGDTMKSYMARHIWAAREMWAGILGPDDAAWANAVKVLNESPLSKAPGADQRWNKEAKALAQDVAALAKLGLASKPEERPGIYGQFIATCASCHTALKIVPKDQ